MTDQPGGAPLYEALRRLSGLGGLRFHLPGHKGRPADSAFDPVFAIDYTELPDTGNLYGAGGPIGQAEALAARYWGGARCFFLTCGATQGVKAAVAAFCRPGGPLVVDRNCHQSVTDACVALDLDPCYVWPELDAGGLTGQIDPDELARALETSGAPAAIVTSPTYYGRLLDVAALADAAHSRNAALIVDAAHGSHLRACGVADPSAAGADAVVYSAHKTLPVLGQGAFLMLHGRRDPAFFARVRRLTALFGTTSPSYPIMASLDLARAGLEGDPAAWRLCARLCAQAARAIADHGFAVRSPAPGWDPCRLTVDTAAGGLTGEQAARLLRARAVEPEMADARHVVAIVTAADRPDDLSALAEAFAALPAGPPLLARPGRPPRPSRALSPRQAYFAHAHVLPLGQCAGKVAAQSLSPYPPGTPAVVCGEVIDKFAVEYLIEKGYNELDPIPVVSSQFSGSGRFYPERRQEL